MRNRKLKATRAVLAELEQHVLQLAMGISLALALVALILRAGEQPPLMLTILVAAIASGLISPPVDRAVQAFWRSSESTLANTTDALWDPDWPEATEVRRAVMQWRRRRRWVHVVGMGLIWALISGFIAFLLTTPQEQWQHDPTKEAPVVSLILALTVGFFGFIVGAIIAHKRTSDWQR